MEVIDQTENIEEPTYTDGDAEAKIGRLLQFMERCLADHHAPRFKGFWQTREICFSLIKESSTQDISQGTRSLLWQRYTELSKEARRLKEMLDEQSAFASEQIHIAIQALEEELKCTIETEPLGLQFSFSCPEALELTITQYAKQQSELSILNSHAVRINTLRKELMKTDMRARKKNLFFQRLSALGDRIFPRRKELIQQVSQQFIKDVEAFIATHFSTEHMHAPFYFLREEIKGLQNMAKALTLNTQAFNHTRLELSHCWDKVKEFEKERKKEQIEQRVIHAERMKVMESEAEERSRQEQERARLAQQRVEELRQEIDFLMQNVSQETVETLELRREELQQKIHSLVASKVEKVELGRLLKLLRDTVLEKKEQLLIVLSDDAKQALVRLQELLQQRKQWRQEAKESIDQLRKASAVSGLDFERAMSYQAQLQEEKDRLEKMSQGVEEIERRIAVLIEG